MAVRFTTDEFLASVRLRGSIPQTTNTSNVNNTSNLLILASEELLIKLLPLIMSTREEFYVTKQDIAIVAGQANYPVPTRASGQVIRDVHIVQGSSVYRLKPIEPEFVTTTNTSDVLAYYFENNNIVLYPAPSSSTSGTLRVRYFRRPSQLALTSNCGQITAIDTVNNIVTCNSVPSTWVVGTQVDFVRATPPYDNQAVDQSITAVTGSQLTFSSLPSDLAVNDWVALAEYTPIPQIPREFQPVLAQMTVVKVLQAQGDAQGAQAALQDLSVLEKNALSLITNRNEGDVHKVISRNWYRR